MAYIGAEPIVSATRTITEVTATAGQTVFVANGGYTSGYVDVFLNGAQLQTVDFTATNGSTITLTEAAQAGDVIRLVAWGTFTTAAELIPSGTKMMFVQTSAPTGWTKDTTHNNKALRVVSGTASTGGSVDFTTAFTSQDVSGTVGTSGATTLSTAQMPSHNHGGGAGGSYLVPSGSFYALPASSSTGSTGGGGSHTHSGGTFTGTAINLAVQYVDVIIATKD